MGHTSSGRRVFTSLLVAGVAANLLVIGAVSAAPAQATSTTVPASLFGMSINTLKDSAPTTGANTLRLWDEGIAWNNVQWQGDGSYDWSNFDKVMANAEASGVTDFEYVLGSPPRWATANQPEPSQSPVAERAGIGTTLFPDDQNKYLEYVSHVMAKYPQIKAYQIWNEANLTDYYRGDPIALANLTKATYELIKAHDPTIKVVGAGSVSRAGRYDAGTFNYKYLNRLKELDWPIDANTVTTYPDCTDTLGKVPTPSVNACSAVLPALGFADLRYATQAYKDLGATDAGKEVWIAEMNYTGLSGTTDMGDSNDRALVARAYLDAQQYGVSRSYWYSWRGWDGSGVQMNSDATSAAAVAYKAVEDWMSNQTWDGCRVDASTQVTTCGMSDGARQVVYVNANTSPVTAPAGANEICDLNGVDSCTPLTAGSIFNATREPVLLKGSGMSFTPPTAPAAQPTGLGAIPRDGEAVVTWQALPGTADGGQPIISYEVVATPANEVHSAGRAASGSHSCTAIAPATSCIIHGLTNGVTYVISVSAINSIGQSTHVSTVTIKAGRSSQTLKTSLPKVGHFQKKINHTRVTATGHHVVWKSLNKRICQVTSSKIMFGSIKGACRVRATAIGDLNYAPMNTVSTIKVRP